MASNCLSTWLPGRALTDLTPIRDELNTTDEVYHGPGLVAARERSIRCARSDRGYRIDIEGIGCISVAADGTHVLLLRRDPATNDGEVDEAALGPGLMLALALQGVFSLHASAVAVDGTCVAFTGASGAGKSTLAGRLDRLGGRWRRIADDILPIDDGDIPSALDFPQPKLSAADQARAHIPAPVPLAAIYCIEAGGGGTAVITEHLDGADGALALLRATVASRLFDERLRRHHLEWCSRVAQTIPVTRLRHPWGEAPIEPLALAVDPTRKAGAP